MTTPRDDDQAEAEVAELRATLDHPVIDADGHLLENMSLLFSTVDRLFGLEALERVVRMLRDDPVIAAGDAATGMPQGPWWGIPNNATDVATASIPALLAERMDRLGLDYAVVYPTAGIGFLTVPDAEVRRALCRATNVMNAELTAPCRDRLTAAALIPVHDPDEAVAELEFAVAELGAKVVMIPPGVCRPLAAHPDAFPAAHTVDRFGLDSSFDYDPFWAAVCEHRLALSVHGGAGYHYLPVPNRSSSNFVANHLLGHASLLVEVAKSLILGGVYDRFPSLHVAYLEGGAGWAVDLMHSMVEHFEKRGPEGIAYLDPSGLDIAELRAAFQGAGLPATNPGVELFSGQTPASLNDWAASGVTTEADLVALFSERIFLGCEGDDRSVRQAMDRVGNLGNVALNAMFASDVGHWDVLRLAGVLLHSRGLVDDGAITDADYRDFVFTNPVKFHAGANPDFFEGTVVADAVAAELALAGSPGSAG